MSFAWIFSLLLCFSITAGATPTVASAMRDYQEFRTEMGARLKESEKRIEALSKKEHSPTGQKETAALATIRRDLRARLNHSRFEGDEKWAAFTKDFRDSEESLEKRISSLEKKP